MVINDIKISSYSDFELENDELNQMAAANMRYDQLIAVMPHFITKQVEELFDKADRFKSIMIVLIQVDESGRMIQDLFTIPYTCDPTEIKERIKIMNLNLRVANKIFINARKI